MLSSMVSTAALSAFLLSVSSAAAYTSPPQNAKWVEAGKYFFNPDDVLQITITFDDDPTADPNRLIDCTSDTPRRATVRIQNSMMDETLTSCGVRNRGTYSRCNPNRSWDVGFDEFVDDQELHGLDGFDLKSGAHDPSSARSWLSWQLFGQMGIAASRCAPAAVTINGRYYGLQDCIEEADKRFMKSWFGNGNGVRIKCVGSIADLTWRGPDRNAYDGDTNNGDGAQGYELKSDDPELAYAKLIEFVDFINNTTDETFQAGIDERLDVDSFLRWLAVNMTIGSWDDYWNSSNNYGLYLPPGSTQWKWIPYDYDYTFGMGYTKINWATRPFDSRWIATGKRRNGTGKAPLTERLLEIPTYRDQFHRYIHEFSSTHFKSETLHSVVDGYQALVTQAASADTRDKFSTKQFLASFSGPTRFKRSSKTPAQLGIKPFIDIRNQYIAAELPRPAPLPTVRIQQIQPINQTGITDEAGEREPWILLENTGSEAVDISGMYVTTSLLEPGGWAIPSGTILNSHATLVIWCDGESGDGPYHASLSFPAGGSVGLRHNPANLKVLIDAFSYPSPTVDQVYHHP